MTESPAPTTPASPVEPSEPKGDLDGINPAVKEAEAKEPKPAPTDKEKAEKAAAAALKRLKVKGKEIEVDESKYHEYAQKGAAATETWMEAAKMKRDADDFMRRLKEDPRSVLTDPNLGVDFRKIAEDYIWEQIQDEQLSPEQKAQRDRDRELEKYKAAEKERMGKAQQEDEQKLKDHYRQDFDKKITEAMSKTQLPKTEYSLDRLIHYMRLDVENGFQQDIGEYVKMVEDDYAADLKAFVGNLSPEQLEKFIGAEQLKKHREHDLKRLKTSTPEAGHTFVPGKGMVKAPAPKRLSGVDWERDVIAGWKKR